jgi:hypothetical protein
MQTIREKLTRFFRSRRANTLLLTTAAAIASTFSVYFFVSLTTLSEEAKQRITHMYNAYTMGISVKGKLDENKALGTETKQDFHNNFSTLQDGMFISLSDMLKQSLITVGYDPTASKTIGDDILYDQDHSGVLITYLDPDGDIIAECTAGDSTDADCAVVVDDVRLFVNLAGTADVAYSNAGKLTFDATLYPYTSGDPFYYVLMDLVGHADYPVAAGLSRTIDTAVFTLGILSKYNGGPQPDNSVILPQDFKAAE